MNKRILFLCLFLFINNYPRQVAALEIGPPESLKLEGFYSYPTIRTGFDPGTLLERYMQDGKQRTRIFYELKDLEISPPVSILRTEEEIPASTYTELSSITGAIEFLLSASGLGSRVAAGYTTGATLEMKYGRGYRETIKGGDIRRIVEAAKIHGLPFPGKYVLITSTISFREINAKLSSNFGVNFGADLAAVSQKAGGKIQVQSGASNTLLPIKYTVPMRAFYSWEEIRPVSGAAVGPGDVDFSLIRGREELPIAPDLN